MNKKISLTPVLLNFPNRNTTEGNSKVIEEKPSFNIARFIEKNIEPDINTIFLDTKNLINGIQNNPNLKKVVYWQALLTHRKVDLIFEKFNKIYILAQQNESLYICFQNVQKQIKRVFNKTPEVQFLKACNNTLLEKHALKSIDFVDELEGLNLDQLFNLSDKMLSPATHYNRINKGFTQNKGILSISFYKCLKLIFHKSFSFENDDLTTLLKAFFHTYYGNIYYKNPLKKEFNFLNKTQLKHHVDHFELWTESLIHTHSIDLKTTQGIAHYFYHVMDKEKDIAFGMIVINALLRWNKLPLFFIEGMDNSFDINVNSPEKAFKIIIDGQKFLQQKLPTKPDFNYPYYDITFNFIKT